LQWWTDFDDQYVMFILRASEQMRTPKCLALFAITGVKFQQTDRGTVHRSNVMVCDETEAFKGG